MQDTIPFQAANIGQSTTDVLTRELNKKYANRVLHDIGLCVSVFDLTKCSEGKVRYGDGCFWYKGLWDEALFLDHFLTRFVSVEFLLVVFKPFVSEVLVGKVKSSSEDGIRGQRVLAGSIQVHLLTHILSFDDLL